MDLDLTQVLDLNEYLDDTEVQEENITANTPVGHLKVFQFKDFPETSFPIHEGDNFIGRDDRCSIAIPAKPISKKHACIEVHDGAHLLYDCDSRNKSKRNKIFLKPQVRYELQNEDQLTFADVNCQYLIGKCKDEADDERPLSGSETGSESMLPEPEKETKEDLIFCPETDDDETDDDQDISKKCFEENRQPVKAVDASCDPLKRLSTGNTLDYGLQTLHNPNFSKDSADISENESAKDDTSRVSMSLEKSKSLEMEKDDSKPKKDHEIETLILDDVSRESTPVKKSKTLEMEKDGDKPRKDDEIETTECSSMPHQTPPEEDTVLDDLMATQPYEVSNIPESPVSSDEVSAIEHDRGRTSEEDAADATQSYAVTSGNDPPDLEAREDIPTLPYEDSNEDPALGTGDEMATQAYGLSNYDDDVPAEEFGNEDATQVYGRHGNNDGDSALQEQSGDEKNNELGNEKVDGLFNDDDVPAEEFGNEDATQVYGRQEQSGDEKNNELGNEEADQELMEFVLRSDNDLQSTQIYNADDESKSFEVNLLSPVVKTNLLKKSDESKKKISKVTFVDTSESDVKPEEKTDESTDTEFPSLSDIGISMTTEKPVQADSDEDFLLPERRSSRKRTPVKKLTFESVSSVTKKSPSVVIEGENSLGSVKRCYIECTPEKKAKPLSKMAKIDPEEAGPELESSSVTSSGRGKTRGRGRKTGARRVPAKRGRKGRGRKEMDEIADEEVIEGDEKEGEANGSKREKEDDVEVGISGKKKNKRGKADEKHGNSEKKSILNEVVEEMKRTGKDQAEKEEEVLENKVERGKDKKQGGLQGDKEDTLGSGRDTTGKGRKKSSLRRGKRGKQNSAEESGGLLDHGGGSKGTIKDASGNLGEEVDIKMDVDEPTGSENIKGTRGDSDEDTGTRNGGANVEKELEEVDQKRNTGSRRRLGKRKLTEEKYSDDGSEKTAGKGKMGKGKMGKNKKNTKENNEEKIEEDDIFKFDDHDPEPQPKISSVAKRQTSRTTSAASTPGKKSGTATESPARAGRKSRQNQETSKQDESSEVLESFKTPEMAVSSSQRSRRSSTSSDVSSQGTKRRGRQRDNKGQEEKAGSPVVSPVRGTPSRKKTKLEPKPDVRVMFTGLLQEEQARKIVQDLNGEVVESVYECTHLVTDKVRRTVKFLCALSRGIPVVDKKWLQGCKKSKSFIDYSGYTVKDKTSEKQHDFSLDRSLEVAREEGLLEGYKVHVTPHVMPKAEFMKDIIQCAKGKFLATMPKSYSKQVLIITCEEDRKLCPQSSAGHAYSSELLLTGVLRQQLDLDQYKMCEKESSTPAKKSTRRR